MACRIPFLRTLMPLLNSAAVCAPVCALMALPLIARADELKLKDGATVKGTIVGFDDNSFKVQTSYGFALVRRDQVVSISMPDSSKEAAPEKKPEPAAEKTPVPEKPKPAAVAAAAPKPVTAAPSAEATKSEEKPVASLSPKTDAPKTATPKAPETAAAPPTAPKLSAPPAFANSTAANTAAAKTTVAKTQPPASPAPAARLALAPSAAPPSTAVAAPKPSAPEPIRETVSGNTYTNNTYRFQMYKPPDWQVLAAERTVLPGAIAALGTNDQETYLLIGQEPAGKPLYLAADAADKRLRDAMENFRPQGQEQMLVAGLWATEHRFRGTVDDHEWSGVVVLVPHGTRLYTIFGMTRADSDLVQIQENVIARAIASLQFTDP